MLFENPNQKTETPALPQAEYVPYVWSVAAAHMFEKNCLRHSLNIPHWCLNAERGAGQKWVVECRTSWDHSEQVWPGHNLPNIGLHVNRNKQGSPVPNVVRYSGLYFWTKKINVVITHSSVITAMWLWQGICLT
ncbi:hypothetical protein K435DRAFT_805641 [Dendrothele bispora CBS 962.96]|uniref:Uncharacterized protein n=1 Tax=Dendrothele bispora (strain CBS 962.96) TaxID=1314807 RepID=A0A4S8LAD4_DENBC|nr:hypothetical protein K435DRAFT_805641 [Dendrothele bispora CBS 962.96]